MEEECHFCDRSLHASVKCCTEIELALNGDVDFEGEVEVAGRILWSPSVFDGRW